LGAGLSSGANDTAGSGVTYRLIRPHAVVSGRILSASVVDVEPDDVADDMQRNHEQAQGAGPHDDNMRI
jgi:hypothetical protein